MKAKIIFLTILVSSSIWAQKAPTGLPDVRPPAELRGGKFLEGTDTKLVRGDIADLLPWSQMAKKVLTRALEDAKLMPLSQRSFYIKEQVQSVVLRSGNKRYQTFLRFALNRGLFLVDELERESNYDQKGIIENQLDILTRCIQVGLKYYESDLDYQKRIQAGESAVVLGHAEFGFDLAGQLAQASINIFDASAQYRTLYKTLEMLNWDLAQDRDARDYSEGIWEIYRGLEELPELPSDVDIVNVYNVRKLNRIKANAFPSILNTLKR